MKKVAVLLTCHNRVEKTLACLDTLFKCEFPNDLLLDVHLVDDGSEDGTSASVSEKFPKVNIIEGSGDLFWSRGMHLAWTTAVKADRYDGFLWLNDDVELYTDSIGVLLEGADLYPHSIICGATQSAVTKEVTYGSFTDDGRKVDVNGEYQKLVGPINGNVILVPFDVYEKIGMLDDFFIHSMADFDYSYRAYRAGISIFMVPRYSGECEMHSKPPKWCRPEVAFFDRLKDLYSPLGNAHPKYFFTLEKRHFGYGRALKHLISIHLRLLFPALWHQRG